MRIGKLLRLCLKRKKWTQKEFLNKLPEGTVSRTHLNAIFNDREQPSLTMLKDILHNLGYRLEDCLCAPLDVDAVGGDLERRARRIFNEALSDDRREWICRLLISGLEPYELQKGTAPQRKRQKRI